VIYIVLIHIVFSSPTRSPFRTAMLQLKFPSADRMTKIFYTFLALQITGAGDSFGCHDCPDCGTNPDTLIFDCNTCSLSKGLAHIHPATVAYTM